jgi:peptidyl-prolyl cis-trans isomerase A (cyclophilin A)
MTRPYPRRAWLRRVAVACLAMTGSVAGIAQTPAAKDAPPRVVLETSVGRIVLELEPAKAPKTVANFVQYVNDGFYDGTIFHRVIADFMVQGGGFTAQMQEKPTREPVASESRNGLKNTRGTVAMARRADPNSATAQFFINVVDNPRLDYPAHDGAGYTVFGHVVEGQDTVEKLRAAPTRTAGGYENVPASPIVIKTARIAK